MRHSGVLAIFAVFTVFCAVGCGSGGGGNSTATASGEWRGTFTQKGVLGTAGTLQAELDQNGTTLLGTVVSTTTAGGVPTGTITGTIHSNQLTATIYTPAIDPLMQRTEELHGFNAPNWYSTSAPIDLTKPLIVSVNGVLLAAGQYTVDRATSTLFSNRIYIPFAIPQTSIVQIQYYPYTPNPNTASTTTFTGSLFGKSLTGTYTTTDTTSAAISATSGTFALTKTR